MERSLTCSPSASAARAPNSITRRFKTGSAPGKPRHTGQVLAFGSSPKRVEHPQKIFDSVLSWAWTSSPMMVSQLLILECAGCDGALDPSRSGFYSRRASIQSGVAVPMNRVSAAALQILRLQPFLRHTRVAGFVLQLLPARLKCRALCQQIIQTLRQAGALFG